VVASSHRIGRAFERLFPRELPFINIDIPDQDPAGVELSFESTDPRDVISLRLHIDISHEERGDLRIDLIHPDGTSVMLEENDNSTRRDIYAIYPDLRSWDEDVVSLYEKPATGIWKVRISDHNSGVTGGFISAMLELDFEGIGPPPPNSPPTANAGKDQTVRVGDQVTLDGSASADPDGDPLGFAWAQSSGVIASLSNTSTAVVHFSAPPVDGRSELIFRLTVDDGRGASTSDEVKIIVVGDESQPRNRDPKIVIKYPKIVRPSSGFVLDGSASSDPDSDRLSFRWLQTGGSTIEFEEEAGAKLELTAPDTEGPLAFRLELEDGRGGLDLADISITISSTLATPHAAIQILGNIDGGCRCEHTTAQNGTIPSLLLVLSLWLWMRLKTHETRKKGN
jgi:subtilisin-like proprotein convertase family protein